MPKGKGVLKAKNLEVKYEAYLELPGGREGVKRKTLCGKSGDIFWNCTMNDHYWSQATGGGAMILPFISKTYMYMYTAGGQISLDF